VTEEEPEPIVNRYELVVIAEAEVIKAADIKAAAEAAKETEEVK
jgi:hypothetical protein